MKVHLSAVVAAAVVLAGGSPARAQHGHGGGHGFGGHGFGGHGYGHGFGGHDYGHGFGHVGFYGHGHLYGWYGYPGAYGYYGYYPTYSYPAIVSSPPLVSSTLTAPAPPPVATALKANDLPAYAGPGVTLRLPAEYPEPVYVLADRREIELKPGAEVVLKDKGSYRVEFDRGGFFGTARLDLPEGAYKMVVGEKGWQLVPDAPAAGEPRRNTLPGPRAAEPK